MKVPMHYGTFSTFCRAQHMYLPGALSTVRSSARSPQHARLQNLKRIKNAHALFTMQIHVNRFWAHKQRSKKQNNHQIPRLFTSATYLAPCNNKCAHHHSLSLGGSKGRKATSIKALHMDQLHASDSLLPLAKRCLCLVLGVQVVCHQTTDMMVQDPSVWAVLCGYDMRMILDE